MKAENRKYSITYHDGSKEIIIGTHNLPPQSQVRSVRLIKDPNPSQNAKNGSEKLSERKYIVKYPDGTETLITGFHNLPDKTSVSAIYRVREDAPNTADTVSEYLCFADFEYTCGGMANDIDFDAAYGQEILSVGLVVALRASGEVQLLLKHIERNWIVHSAYVTLKGFGVHPMSDSELVAKLFCSCEILAHAIHRRRAVLECADVYLICTSAKDAVPLLCMLIYRKIAAGHVCVKVRADKHRHILILLLAKIGKPFHNLGYVKLVTACLLRNIPPLK